MARRAAETSTDEHLDYIATLLDDMFRVPGTQIRFGLDFLIGWIPVVGDSVAGFASLVIVFAAWRRGAHLITLARMITNVVLEAAVGSVPVIGDVFHVVWKANRRNYRLLMRERSRGLAESYVLRDALFFGLLLLGVVCLIAIPIGLIYLLIHAFLRSDTSVFPRY